MTEETRKSGGKVVLVVDDEALLRMLAADFFEELGCEALEAGNGAEALAKLESRPDISLMFTDCRMPGMSGQELAEAAVGQWPDLRIVLVTGYHNADELSFPTVFKPYDASVIRDIVDEHL